MDPTTAFILLPGRSAPTCLKRECLTMWVGALDAARAHRRQAVLIEAINWLGLRLQWQGCAVVILLREDTCRRLRDGI